MMLNTTQRHGIAPLVIFVAIVMSLMFLVTVYSSASSDAGEVFIPSLMQPFGAEAGAGR